MMEIGVKGIHLHHHHYIHNYLTPSTVKMIQTLVKLVMLRTMMRMTMITAMRILNTMMMMMMKKSLLLKCLKMMKPYLHVMKWKEWMKEERMGPLISHPFL